MNLTTRLCVFAALSLAGVLAWQWHQAADSSHEITALAVQQFGNDGALPDKLQQASQAQNWWPLVWPALVVMLGIVLFWDDVERWWKHEEK
jgi:hypothetical protein